MESALKYVLLELFSLNFLNLAFWATLPPAAKWLARVAHEIYGNVRNCSEAPHGCLTCALFFLRALLVLLREGRRVMLKQLSWIMPPAICDNTQLWAHRPVRAHCSAWNCRVAHVPLFFLLLQNPLHFAIRYVVMYTGSNGKRSATL